MSQSPAVQITELSQRFVRQDKLVGTFLALDDVSFTVPQGSIFGFLGPNGAGKTTLIHIIAGLKKPWKGKAAIFGEESHSIAARTQIGYLPERPYFYDHLTAEEFLIYFGTLSNISKQIILERVPKVLETVGLSHARDLRLKKFSKGMLQRVGMAQAIIHDPKLLILDEPMSGLDPTGRREVRELILKFRDMGKTVFFSTHILPDVEAICDELALIKKGKVLKCGSIRDFIADGSGEYEITLRSTNASGFEVLKSIPRSEVNQILSRAIAEDRLVESVSPIKRSLEDYFEEKS